MGSAEDTRSRRTMNGEPQIRLNAGAQLVTTYLEMTSPPLTAPPVRQRANTRSNGFEPTGDFYRFLYGVGRPPLVGTQRAFRRGTFRHHLSDLVEIHAFYMKAVRRAMWNWTGARATISKSPILAYFPNTRGAGSVHTCCVWESTKPGFTSRPDFGCTLARKTVRRRCPFSGVLDSRSINGKARISRKD